MISKSTAWAWGLALVTVLAPATVAADEWDFGVNDDDDTLTKNSLLHGSEQVHDLNGNGEIDEDWSFVEVRPFSSYEVRVDGLTGTLDLTSTDVQRMSVTGTQVEQSALVTDSGGVLSLNWQRGASAGGSSTFVRVHDASCGLACTLSARYRIRLFDTTFTVPRFNNSGTQASALIVQNATDRACEIAYHFLDAAGALLLTAGPITLPARGLDVHPASVALPGASGSVRVTHTCGYGGLAGKAVSVEPSTGFTFDTALAHRPH